MKQPSRSSKDRYLVRAICTACTWALLCVVGVAPEARAVPLVSAGHAVQWWFVFKFNGATFPGCKGESRPNCAFGGRVRSYKSAASQQYVYASSDGSTLAAGSGCAGDTADDPLGATFEEIYDGTFFFVVYNDQFYQAPDVPACPGEKSCLAPWGHSKGIVAWDQDGNGLLLQVTTPSWPAAGSRSHPRTGDGNTLGCVSDNNLLYSQHFFALQLTRGDLADVLAALGNASVVTDVSNPQIVHLGGPEDIKTLVEKLGQKSDSNTATLKRLSTGVQLISKPASLNVPPWQLVSSLLGGVPLRAATWWDQSRIPTTTASTEVGCWDNALTPPGAVEIAETGEWDGQTIGLKGGGKNGNHAKIAVSLDADSHYAIFGDMNQEGSLMGNCAIHQNGRGGIFVVVQNEALWTSVSKLIAGETAPSSSP